MLFILFIICAILKSIYKIDNNKIFDNLIILFFVLIVIAILGVVIIQLFLKPIFIYLYMTDSFLDLLVVKKQTLIVFQLIINATYITYSTMF